MKKVTLVLVLVIAIVALLLINNRQTNRTWPSLTSSSPSGIAAFVELLRRDGYKVTLNRTSRLKTKDVDLTIVPTVEFATKDERDDSEYWNYSQDKFQKSLAALVEGKGRILTLEFPNDFDKATKKPEEMEVTTFSTGFKNLVVTLPPEYVDYTDKSLLPYLDNTSVSVWFDTRNESGVVRKYNYQGQNVTHILPGMIASNRMIARRDNAKLLLHVVHGLAAPGSSIVIAEGLFNRQDENVFSLLGRWASFAWWQTILVAGVIFFSLSRRFGHPVADRKIQRGARDLVDAIADSIRMARKGNFALSMSVYDAEKRVRSVLRLPRSAKPEVYMHEAGERIQRAWQTASVLANSPKVKERTAVDAVQELESAVSMFEKDSRSSRKI